MKFEKRQGKSFGETIEVTDVLRLYFPVGGWK